MAFIVPIISAVASIGGSIMQAGQQQAAAQAQANAAYYNAAVAQNNATAAMQAAEANKLQQDRKNRSMLENVKSKYLGSGVELEGTPLMMLDEQTTQGALEADKILYHGKIQAMNYTNEANMARYQGDTALSLGSSQASGTMMGGMISGISGAARAFAGG